MQKTGAFALLALLALSGCFGGTEAPDDDVPVIDPAVLSPAQFDILPGEEFPVTASDGVVLSNAVFRPDTDEAVPAFINFSPYWGDSAILGGDPFSQYMIAEYVPRGYAVVLSAVRGTGHSGGCFQLAGDRELQDANEVIDAVSKAAWSTGAVASGGKSYDSTTINGVIAKFPHEALKGVFHVSGITDMYRYNYRNGVPYTTGAAFNTYYTVGQGTHEYGLGGLVGQVDPTGLGGLVTGSPAEASSSDDEDAESLLRLLDDVACAELPESQSSGVASGAHGLKDAYWQERDWTQSIAASTWEGSIFFVHGLQDWNVKPDHILPWLGNLPEGIHVTGWLHQWQQDGTGHVYPMRTDWNVTMLAWMDLVLKGIDTGVTDGFQVQSDDAKWRSSATWPDVEGSAPQSLPLATDGGIPLPAGTRVTGAPVLHVTFTPETPDPVLKATWVDVDETGAVQWVNEAVLRGTLRDGLEAPAPVVPGTPFEAALEFYPMDTVLAEGHSWRLVLGFQDGAGSSDAGTLTTPAQEGGAYDAAGATLELLAVQAVPVLPEQPLNMTCFTC